MAKTYHKTRPPYLNHTNFTGKAKARQRQTYRNIACTCLITSSSYLSCVVSVLPTMSASGGCNSWARAVFLKNFKMSITFPYIGRLTALRPRKDRLHLLTRFWNISCTYIRLEILQFLSKSFRSLLSTVICWYQTLPTLSQWFEVLLVCFICIPKMDRRGKFSYQPAK